MTTTVNLRKILDRKRWETCTPSPTATPAGHFVVAPPPTWPVQRVLVSQGTSVQYLYDVHEDSWIEIAAGTLGAHVAGSCGVFHPAGPTGTATAGSTTTLTTNLTINTDLTGYTVRTLGGTGAGQELVITSNTLGANSVLSFATATAVDNTTTYVILSGRYWCLGATGAAVVWKYYDVATAAWSAKSVTSGPGATWATDGRAVQTHSASQVGTIATGTATSGGATTLTNSGASWTTNQWAQFQVRITGGLGKGQIRTINSNNGTVLTVSAAWGTNPDATSTYTIEGNDDFIYVMGNAAVALFRYAINGVAGLNTVQATGDTWVTLSPGAARSVAPGAGASASWISDEADARYDTEATMLNGRRIYSFRGTAGAVLDYYDIAANTWVSGVSYGGGAPVFGSGSADCDYKGKIFLHKDATGRFFKFDVGKQQIQALSTLPYTQGGALIGNRMWVSRFSDGGTEVLFLYHLRNTGTELFRLMLI